jgi:hypothetical protein
MDHAEKNVLEVSDEELLPELYVFVNAGFGRRSYMAKINADSTMNLPEGLVRELNFHVGDELEWRLDEETATIFVSVIRNEWAIPEWLEE